MEHLLLQNLVQKLDGVRSGQPASETLRKIQGAVDQFAAVSGADSYTLYVRNPWSKEYGLAHLVGITKREFMWDSPDSASAFSRIEALLSDCEVWDSHYKFFSDARSAVELAGREPNSFVDREKVRSTAVLYAFPQGLSPIALNNAILFLNWRTLQPKDRWKPHATWVRLFAHSLYGAIEKLIHESAPNLEILGRHMALAKKLSSNLPRVTAGGAPEMVGLLAELGGPQTGCAIYAVDHADPALSLRSIACSPGTTITVAGSVAKAAASHRISVKAALLNKVIYVDDFGDPNWRKRYARPAPNIASELAIPIVVERNIMGSAVRRVEYVVSLYRSAANAFSYEEIGLIRGSAAHIQIVLGRADDAVDAVCHDIRNLAQVVYEQAAIFNGLISGAQAPTIEEVLAPAIVTSWAAANCELLPAALCGFPRLGRQSSTESLDNILLWVERAQKVLDPTVSIHTHLSPGITTSSGSIVGQMLWNLVHNAAKFADEKKPEIWVNVRIADGRCVLTVEDNGRGFGALRRDEIAGLFMPKRANGAKHGQGWGLFIVKTCAESLGGTVSARNRGGGKQGARFEVQFPE